MSGRNARRLALKGTHWTQRQEDGFAVVTMRFPCRGMPAATYQGNDAAERLRRFCIGFLKGSSDGRRELGQPADPVVDALLAEVEAEGDAN